MNLRKCFGIVLFAIVAAVLLFVLAQVGSFIAIYQGVAAWISANSTLEEHWSAALAAIATAGAWGAMPGILGFVIFGRSSPRWILALSAVALLMGGVLFFAGGEAFFGPDGRPTRCYGFTPDGIKVAPFPRSATNCPVDRTFRTPMHPMSAEIVPSVLAAKRGIVPKRLDAEWMGPTFAYFNASNGKPNVFYVDAASDGYELFNGPGFHPSLQVPLVPVTRDTAQALGNYVTSQYNRAVKRREREAKERAAQLTAREARLATREAQLVAREEEARAIAAAQVAEANSSVELKQSTSQDAEIGATYVARVGAPVVFNVPPGHRWEMVGEYPSAVLDYSGYRDERDNLVQTIRVLPPSTEATFRIVVAQCEANAACAW